MPATSPHAGELTSFRDTYVGPRGHSLLPGGFGREMLAVGPWSPLAVRGEGYLVWDDRGRELIDLNNNFTTLVHGHAHPAIVEAAVNAIRSGASFGMPTASEIHHARTLLSRFEHHDQVRYTNSGTESVLLATRIARAHTKREKLLMVRGSYHGWADPVLPTGGPHFIRGVTQGVLKDSTVVPFNDVEALVDAVEKDPAGYAAILLDLIPNRVGMQLLSTDYIETARSLADAYGIALIVDEVISLRLAIGGLSSLRGCVPDMIALGKPIGGGLPAGAVIGKAEWMAELDPLSGKLEHGGTFSANPVSMEAGVAALELLDAEAIARINGFGDRARSLLKDRVEAVGWEARGYGSLMRLFPLNQPDNEAVLELQRQLWWQAYERGVTLAKHGVCAFSTVMDEDVVDQASEALGSAVEAVAAASGT